MEILKSDSFDAVMLDINLPDIDGFEVLKRVRSFSDVPVLIVTVRGEEDDQVKGLEMGADDYIIKPFSPRDVIARVNSVLRRTSTHQAVPPQISIVQGKLFLNFVTGEARLGEEKVKLTPNESKMLYVLMTNAGNTVSSEQVSGVVWGKNNTKTDLVRTYIRRLRDKLKDKPPQIIINQRGEGYRFVSPT